MPVDRGAARQGEGRGGGDQGGDGGNGRQLIIYPEGTRRPPGASRTTSTASPELYRDLGVPVVPVVMHPGLFWPRRKFLRYPGNFKVRILPPIPPGLDPDDFLAPDRRELETAERRAAARNGRGNPHVPPAADGRDSGSRSCRRMNGLPQPPQPRPALRPTSSSQWSRMPICRRCASVLATYPVGAGLADCAVLTVRASSRETRRHT